MDGQTRCCRRATLRGLPITDAWVISKGALWNNAKHEELFSARRSALDTEALMHGEVNLSGFWGLAGWDTGSRDWLWHWVSSVETLWHALTCQQSTNTFLRWEECKHENKLFVPAHMEHSHMNLRPVAPFFLLLSSSFYYCEKTLTLSLQGDIKDLMSSTVIWITSPLTSSNERRHSEAFLLVVYTWTEHF